MLIILEGYPVPKADFETLKYKRPLNIYQTEKRNANSNHKRRDNFAGSKVCQLLLHYTTFAIGQNGVQENWRLIKCVSNCKDPR